MKFLNDLIVKVELNDFKEAFKNFEKKTNGINLEDEFEKISAYDKKIKKLDLTLIKKLRRKSNY
jgi:hypothetical protein